MKVSGETGFGMVFWHNRSLSGNKDVLKVTLLYLSNMYFIINYGAAPKLKN